MSAYRRDWRPPEPARKLTGVAWLLVALALAAVVAVWLLGLHDAARYVSEVTP